MALPTKTDVQTLQYSADGSPWCKVTAKSTIDPDTLEYSLDGSPWWGIGGSGSAVEEFIALIIWM